MLTEALRVHLVHCRELREVDQKDRALHDLVEATARRLEDRGHVVEHPRGLELDLAADDLAGGGIDPYLAGGEDEVAACDRLALRADGLRSLLGGHATQIHSLPLLRERGGDRSREHPIILRRDAPQIERHAVVDDARHDRRVGAAQPCRDRVRATVPCADGDGA